MKPKAKKKSKSGKPPHKPGPRIDDNGGDQQRKHEVLSHRVSSITSSIGDAIIGKSGDMFVVTTSEGSMPISGNLGFGLYYHDCRFLSGWSLLVDGAAPASLAATSESGSQTVYELVPRELASSLESKVHPGDLTIRIVRTLNGSSLTMSDQFEITNWSIDSVDIKLSIELDADFYDLFRVRGLLKFPQGKHRKPAWHGGQILFGYKGIDNMQRFTAVSMFPAPDAHKNTTAIFRLRLPPRKSREIAIMTRISEGKKPPLVHAGALRHEKLEKLSYNLPVGEQKWFDHFSKVESDAALFDRIINRSFRDLMLLKTELDGKFFFAAGIPWFVTVFGRDSLITALQTLAYQREVAAQTLRTMAHFQGTVIDEWRDEEPGRILHELRVGELARAHKIPHTPYYGTVDATQLFLITVVEHAFWTGDLTLFNELRPCIEAALEWIDRYGATDHHGYVTYSSPESGGLANLGWKDSGDAIVNRDGSIVAPPVALVEVQAYVYMAKCGVAKLFELSGDTDRAGVIRKSAEELRSRFNREFWLAKEGCYALALQKDLKPARVISSNAGHALWAGIADPAKARKVARVLMTDNCFSGWGIRTISNKEIRYNPASYHLGSVWPHDNSIIAAGLKRYGMDAEANCIANGIFDAATHFKNSRLPELFCGMPRSEHTEPVHYPVACHPQAWAAGSVPYLLQTILGLNADGFAGTLRITRPTLPNSVKRLLLKQVRVGSAEVDLEFERLRDGNTSVSIMRQKGKLDVIVEPCPNECTPGKDS
jgi:glycogen debranching enzyme